MKTGSNQFWICDFHITEKYCERACMLKVNIVRDVPIYSTAKNISKSFGDQRWQLLTVDYDTSII